jgi:hypothetical protein
MSAIPRQMSAIPRRTSHFDNLSFSEHEEIPSQEQRVEVSRTLLKRNVRGITDVGQFGLAALPWLRLPSEANLSTRGCAMTDQLSFDLDADRDNDSPLIGSAKNERTLMAYNFFALTKERQTKLPRYDDGKYSIEVKGTEDGVATIWDKELLIYLESLLQDRLNRGETPSPIFQFTANDLVPHHRHRACRNRLRWPRGYPEAAQRHDDHHESAGR